MGRNSRIVLVRDYTKNNGTNVTQHERKIDAVPERESYVEPNIISLKEFKKMIQNLGYQVKTEVHTYRHLSVYKNNEYIAGSGGNVVSSEKMEKNRAVFDLLNKYRGKVFDTDYEPPLKVLF